METLLSFEKVYKDYPSGPSIIHALKETNFEAKKGELIAIVGPSGSGKSTLLSLELVIAQISIQKIYLAVKSNVSLLLARLLINPPLF